MSGNLRDKLIQKWALWSIAFEHGADYDEATDLYKEVLNEITTPDLLAAFSTLAHRFGKSPETCKLVALEDMHYLKDAVYPRNETCPNCDSRNTSVAIHGAIRQWWCQSCGKPFMPKELGG